MRLDSRAPLSDDDFDALAELLSGRSPLDTDGVLGLLHAVAVAPSVLFPSAWFEIVLPGGPGDLGLPDAERLMGLVLRLYNEVIDAVSHHAAILPAPEDIPACESFAAGYAAAAEIDAEWIGHDDRWTFASCIAYLGGRLDLVPKETLAKFDADTKNLVCRQFGALIAATYESFAEIRRGGAQATVVKTARVGRNEPCPCGSGKKYKRCCIDRTPDAPR